MHSQPHLQINVDSNNVSNSTTDQECPLVFFCFLHTSFIRLSHLILLVEEKSLITVLFPFYSPGIVAVKKRFAEISELHLLGEGIISMLQ